MELIRVQNIQTAVKNKSNIDMSCKKNYGPVRLIRILRNYAHHIYDILNWEYYNICGLWSDFCSHV